MAIAEGSLLLAARSDGCGKKARSTARPAHLLAAFKTVPRTQSVYGDLYDY